MRGNVTLGADFTDDEVWAALRVAAADDFVAALPDGLDTRVGERGATLSGGQRQRLALARAVVRRPRLLVLDDATSAVDPSVEARILDALRDGERPVDRGRRRLPAGHDRAGRRGGLARARPGARPRQPRASCSPRCPATPALVRAYSQADERGGVDPSRALRGGPDERRRADRPTAAPEGALATLRRGLRMMPRVPPRAAGRPSPSRCSRPPAGWSCRSPSSRPSTAG